MNRMEVIMTIKKVGAEFGSVMSVLCGEEYTAGYKRAVSDMVKLFSEAPIDPDFEAERKAMLARIRQLKATNAELEQENCDQYATIQKLLSHVNVAEVLGVGVHSEKKEEPKAQRRGVAFIFK